VSDAVSLALLSLSLVGVGLPASMSLRRRLGLSLVGLVGLAYMVGFVVVGVVASWLAILGIGLGRNMLVLAGLGGAGWVVWGRRKGRVTFDRTPALALEEGVVLALLVFVGGILTWALVESPLRVSDGIAIWALKAHALFETGSVSGPVFTGHAYAAPTHTDYPIFLPSIEALLSRFLGRFDQALLDVAFGPLLVGFGVTAWALLRPVAHRWLAVVVPVVVVGNANIAGSLGDNYADAPLALLVGLAVVCVVRWTSEGGRSLIALATLFLIGAAWTKNEGLLFAVALLLVTGVIAGLRGRDWRQPALALAGVLLAILPWRLHLAFAGVGNTDYAVSDLLDPRARHPLGLAGALLARAGSDRGSDRRGALLGAGADGGLDGLVAHGPDPHLLDRPLAHPAASRHLCRQSRRVRRRRSGHRQPHFPHPGAGLRRCAAAVVRAA
jgi:hypothetical protein